MTALDKNLHANLGRWKNTSIYAQASVRVHNEEEKDIRALDWCPGPVVLHL